MQNLPRLARDIPLKPQLADGQAIKIIGLGGVGITVARYSALLLAPLCRDRAARLVLVDGDEFEAANAARMLFSTYGNKAAVVRDDLLPFFADGRLTITAVEEFVTPDNIRRLIHEDDVILACLDNHASRKLLSDVCATERDNVVLISGGNDGVGADSTGRYRRGTFGNCQIHIRKNGEGLSPPLTQFHPEIENPADRPPHDLSCTELVASVPQIPVANLTTAAAILNTLWLYLCGAAHYSELTFDIADGVMNPLPLHAASK